MPFVAILAVIVLTFAAPAYGGEQTPRYAGRPVAEVLKELESGELRFIFSSDLVPGSLLVKSEPSGKRARDIAEQILAPHGLGLETGPRGRLLVVALERPRADASRPRPAPAAAGQPPGDAQQAPAAIRIDEWVDVTQRLKDERQLAGMYGFDPPRIRETAGAFENVLQALQVLPAAAATNDEDGKLAVRGAGPEHNKVVIDGVQIHNPYRLGEFTSSFLNPATAASVRLDPSGLDARHGGRLSSITIIETRDGSSDRRLALSGSLGLTNGDVLLEGRLPKTSSGTWWATARGTYYRPFINRFGDDAVPGFVDGQFKITLRPSARSRLTLFGLAGRETSVEHDHVTVIGDSGGSGSSEDGPLVPGARFTGLNRVAAMNLSVAHGPRLATTTTLSAYAHNAREHDPSLVIAGVPPFERQVNVRDLAFRERIVAAPSARHLLDAGVEVHGISSDWRMEEVRRLDSPRGLGPTTWGEFVDYSDGPIRTNLSRTQFGAWAQDRIDLGATWIAEPGVRLDWNSFTRETAWQPRLRISGRVGGTLVWSGVAVQAQTPSHEGLQGFEYFHLTQDAGARLRNERSRQIVAGLEQPFAGGFSLRIEGYRREFDRLLVQRLETDAERESRLSAYDLPPDLPSDSVLLEHRPTSDPESTGRGSAAGLEVQLEREGRRVTGLFAYTLSRATRDMYGATFPFDFDRRHAARATATVQIERHVRVAATWLAASGFPATPVREEILFLRDFAPDGSVSPLARAVRRPDGSLAITIDPRMRRLSSRNSVRLNGYSRTDVRATYATLGRWEFYGEVLNVFNQRNHIQTIQIPPSVSRTGGSVSENNIYTYFERLPSFGIRVKF